MYLCDPPCTVTVVHNPTNKFNWKYNIYEKEVVIAPKYADFLVHSEAI